MCCFWGNDKLEFGESVDQGLQRKIFEDVEINITPFKKQIVGISEYSLEKTEGTKCSVQLNYVVDVLIKDLTVKLNAKHIVYVWNKRFRVC